MKLSPLKRVAFVAATGFGLGYSPIAPGTAGTLLGILPVLLLFPRLDVPGQILASLLMALAAIPLCGIAERALGTKDDGRIVADEYLCFPICFIGLIGPETELLAGAIITGIAFLSFRFFDIVKPPPARQLQTLHGGFGIVIDDVFAALYSLAFNMAAVWALTRFGLL